MNALSIEMRETEGLFMTYDEMFFVVSKISPPVYDHSAKLYKLFSFQHKEPLLVNTLQEVHIS